tara:strand:+ start:413 stop:655 length:243 start_codon:yes stop_codon:yes gene_type:complete
MVREVVEGGMSLTKDCRILGLNQTVSNKEIFVNGKIIILYCFLLGTHNMLNFPIVWGETVGNPGEKYFSIQKQKGYSLFA